MLPIVGLKLPHLRLCVTSRLETDIQGVLGAFDPYTVSLDTQPGHIETLAQCVKSTVNLDDTMGKWSDKTKGSIVDTLGGESGGMYVMIVVTLRTVFSCNDFQVWDLYGTYETTLNSIPEKKKRYAHRMFQ